MFQGFLDIADYWFGYSNSSSAGSYDPVNAANVAEAGDGEVPPARELDRTRVRGRVHHPLHHQGVPTSTHSWPKRASLRPNSLRSTAQCGYFAPPSPGKHPRDASVRAN
jgi:hypothetical protein